MPYLKNEKVRVILYTSDFRILGDIYIIPGSRLTDMLNIKGKDFIALTDASILGLKENTVFVEVPFLAIKRDSIVAVHPLSKTVSKKEKKKTKEELILEGIEE